MEIYLFLPFSDITRSNNLILHVQGLPHEKGFDPQWHREMSDTEVTAVREEIKAAFVHAWDGYAEHAFGHDEIRPSSNATNDSWGGWGATMVDCIDTMLIMDLASPYERAREFVSKLTFDKDYDFSFFETTIRYLGGLLSAYDLSGDSMFLNQADALGSRLLHAFNSTSGLPYHVINMHTLQGHPPDWLAHTSILSEVGSVQLEFNYLSKHTGKLKYHKVSHGAIQTLDKMVKDIPGLYPVYIEVDKEIPQFKNHHVSYGALGDSFYEYLGKLYIQSGRTNPMYRRMYDECMNGLIKHLLQYSYPSGMAFIAETSGLQPVQLHNKFDHLVCFAPGMLALNAEGPTHDLHMRIAKELMYTCYQLYRQQPTGIAPEIVMFNNNAKDTTQKNDFTVQSPKYILRPETIESLFVLYRKTGDVKYRRWGYDIWKSIEKHCRTDSAFSGINDVRELPPTHNNSMQSFFMSETLKYLYLLFSDHTVIPLDKYTFTTEAHPLGNWERYEWNRET